jgi:hypothetical protein
MVCEIPLPRPQSLASEFEELHDVVVVFTPRLKNPGLHTPSIAPDEKGFDQNLDRPVKPLSLGYALTVRRSAV